MNTSGMFDLVCRDIDRMIAVDSYSTLCTLLYEVVAEKLDAPPTDQKLAPRVKALFATSGEIKVKGHITAKVLNDDLANLLKSVSDKKQDLLCYCISLLDLNDDQKKILLAFAVILDEPLKEILTSTPEEICEHLQEKVS
jgi:hypothetical protein